MEFIQLISIPRDGIPATDGLCFGIKTNRTGSYIEAPIYRFRDHPDSNKNNGGWVVIKAKTNFKLTLIL